MSKPEYDMKKNRPGGGNLTIAILIATCAFLAVFSFGLYDMMRANGRQLQKEMASFEKERAEFKDRLTELENSKLVLEDSLSDLKMLSEKTRAKTQRIISILKRRNAAIRKMLDARKKMSVVELINDAASREINDNIKRVLTRTVTDIGLVLEGKSVQLDQIVVVGDRTLPDTAGGNIVSVDRKNSMIIMDIGSGRGAKEGRRCNIYDNDGEIASGTIIRTRFDMSAVFIDAFALNRTIDDVKEGKKTALQ